MPVLIFLEIYWLFEFNQKAFYKHKFENSFKLYFFMKLKNYFESSWLKIYSTTMCIKYIAHYYELWWVKSIWYFG